MSGECHASIAHNIKSAASANRRDLMWSKSEKVIASKTLEAALERERQGVIQEAKRMASQIASRGEAIILYHCLHWTLLLSAETSPFSLHSVNQLWDTKWTAVNSFAPASRAS